MNFKRAICLAAVLCLTGPALWAGVSWQAGDVDFTLGSHSWFRYEANDNTHDFHVDLQDDGEFTTYRLRVYLDASMGRNVRTFFEGQVNHVWGADSTQFYEGDSSTLHLYQGYLELEDAFGSPFRLRLGRQELTFRSDFLLGADEFYYGQAFDAIRIDWPFETGMITVFDAKLVETASPDANDANLYGLYGTFFGEASYGLDVYGFHYADRADNVSLTGTTSKTTSEISTLGAFFYFDQGELWDWSVEAAYQTGEVFGDFDHTGYAFEGTVGRGVDWFDYPQRLGLGLAYYSGDDNPLDTDADFFFSMGQEFHGRYGIYDFFHNYWNESPTSPDTLAHTGTAYYGATILQGNYDIEFSERWAVRANLISFWTAEDSFKHFAGDYTVNDSAGLEADIIVDFTWNEHLEAQVGLSNLWPGKHFRETMGSGDHAYRGYVMSVITW